MAQVNVAHTILKQLGGVQFLTMTGAKGMVSYPDALSFKLPARFAKNKINFVKVTLGADDLYTVDFKYFRGLNIKDISKHEGVYCDMLQTLFTSETGLDTHL